MRLLLFLLTFLIQQITNKTPKFITLPFKINKYTYKLDKEGLLKDHLYKDISLTLTIGTPKQEIPMLIGFGEYSTYILSNKVNGYDGIAKYNKELSSTYKTSQKYSELFFYQIFNEAFRSNENLYLKNPQYIFKNFEFLLATEIGANICYLPYCEILTQPGVLGLRMSDSENLNELINNTNFITQLKKKDIINNYDFSFLFDNDDNGTLIIGEKPDDYDIEHYDKENFVCTKVYIDNEKEKDWSLMFDNVFYGNEKLINDKKMIMRVEYGLIDGDKRWQKILENNFFNELISKGICFKGKGYNDGHSYYHYYCDKTVDLNNFQPLNFVINDLHYNLTLTKNDLFKVEGNKVLFLMIFGHYDLILGMPFFKKYQFVFNQRTKTIGLYTKINGNPLPPVPMPIISVVKYENKNLKILTCAGIFIAVIILVCFICKYYEKYRGNKKKTILVIGGSKQDIQLAEYRGMNSE